MICNSPYPVLFQLNQSYLAQHVGFTEKIRRKQTMINKSYIGLTQLVIVYIS